MYFCAIMRSYSKDVEMFSSAAVAMETDAEVRGAAERPPLRWTPNETTIEKSREEEKRV